MKVSLITVTYNRAATLKDTIDSVLNQSYDNIEYIIKDGGSTDGTNDLIRKYEPKFGERLVWVSEKDEGIYDAINKGISLATGDIIGIINSDDYYHSNTIIEEIVNEFKNNEVDAVFGDVVYVKPNNIHKIVRYYSSRFFTLNKTRFGLMPPHPSFFTYRHYFKEYGGYKTDYKIAADYDLMARFLYVHKMRYKYMPKAFLTMRTGGTSTHGVQNVIIRNNKEIIRACKENNIYTTLCLVCSRYLFKIMGLFLKDDKQ